MFYKTLKEFKEDNGYEIEGIWYPRVTSIVSIKAKPALLHYYGGHKSYAHAEAAMNRSAEEGTLVHEVVEAIFNGDSPAVPEDIEPVISEFISFNNQRNIIAHQIEPQVISKKHNYAGTLDVIAEIDGKLGVLDIKTSQAIYRDYNIQTAAYVEALKEDESVPELTRWILRLDQSRPCLNGCGAKLREKGGNVKVLNSWNGKARTCSHSWGPVTGEAELKELDNLEHDTKAFLAAKQLWEWEHHEWLSQIT
ncbi:MAG: hypothetical protein ABH833_02810 [Parcubacteria group bacterium]